MEPLGLHGGDCEDEGGGGGRKTEGLGLGF